MSSRDEAGSPNRSVRTPNAGCPNLRIGEEVTDALKKIDKTIIIDLVAKHWDLDEQKKAMKVSEEEMKSVVAMSDLLKMLIYHEYPVTAVTFVQPEEPGEMHISAADDPIAGLLSIQFSPALLGAIADSKDEPFSDIELIVREDVQRAFYTTVDYLDAKICKEREWLDHITEGVETETE